MDNEKVNTATNAPVVEPSTEAEASVQLEKVVVEMPVLDYVKAKVAAKDAEKSLQDFILALLHAKIYPPPQKVVPTVTPAATPYISPAPPSNVSYAYDWQAEADAKSKIDFKAIAQRISAILLILLVIALSIFIYRKTAKTTTPSEKRKTKKTNEGLVSTAAPVAVAQPTPTTAALLTQEEISTETDLSNLSFEEIFSG